MKPEHEKYKGKSYKEIKAIMEEEKRDNPEAYAKDQKSKIKIVIIMGALLMVGITAYHFNKPTPEESWNNHIERVKSNEQWKQEQQQQRDAIKLLEEAEKLK
ncbi:hypothetical protein NLU03_07245 [Bacillus toyonensis]|nr:hypothetical protein [Bacillus toyonensis]